MGQGRSKHRDKEIGKTFDALELTTHFSRDELMALYEQFLKISASHTADGVIDEQEFGTALGLKNEALCKRIFAQFDENGDGEINFQEFVCSLSILSEKGTLAEKCKFSFGLYMSEEGCITKESLYEMLEVALVDTGFIHLSEDDMRELVEETFVQVDTDGDGVICYEEYEAMVTKNPSIVQFLTVRVLNSEEDSEEESE